MNEIKIYVSPNGNDGAAGSKEAPIFSVEEAVKRAEQAKKTANFVTVLLEEGEYKVNGINLNSNDAVNENCKITYKGEGKVVFNGGMKLKSSSFEKISGQTAGRLSQSVRDNVYVCDLKKYGITKEMLGPVYAVGAYNSAARYDGDVVGNNVEVFCNDRRMILARYPNNGFVQVKNVAEEDQNTSNTPNLKSIRNPNGGTIVVDDETAERIAKWKEPDKAWLFGYLYWDWADISSPIKEINVQEKTVKLAFSSNYGIRENTNYFLYNALEELDIPGEYYIDREEQLLYIYPIEDIKSSDISISLAKNPIIYAENVSNISFEGITFKECRNNAIEMKSCNNIVIKDCTIKNIYGWAIRIDGYNNLVCGCDVSHTGKGGICIMGGDRATLTPGNSVAENNYIHDWSEVYLTYNAGIALSGCGLTARHNELARTPHVAISYSGNDMLIEYNYIHEAVQQSHDAGAIYAGRDWTAYGTVIRYNLLRNTGNSEFHPAAIYWDDTLAGQTAYGNIIDGSGAKGFLCGGGRDCVVINNIVTGCQECTLMYDDRGREGLLHGGWFNVGMLWDQLSRYNFNESPWIDKYPAISKIHKDMNRTDDLDFGPNPSRAKVNRNIFVHNNHDNCYNGVFGCYIAQSVIDFGDVNGNLAVEDNKECFVDGTFELNEAAKQKLPDFERIPIEKIGLLK